MSYYWHIIPIRRKAELIEYSKVIDESGNTIEISLWRLAKPTEEKPHECKSPWFILQGMNRQSAIQLWVFEGVGLYFTGAAASAILDQVSFNGRFITLEGGSYRLSRKHKLK